MAHALFYNQIFSSCDRGSAQSQCETAWKDRKVLRLVILCLNDVIVKLIIYL